jgi:hypothetical protein
MVSLLSCPCPKCQQPSNLLVFTSQLASVDYYRCDPCVHSWCVPKGALEPTKDITFSRPAWWAKIQRM